MDSGKSAMVPPSDELTRESARRDAPLAMDAASFRAVGHQLVDDLAELLASIPRRPVTRGESPTAVRRGAGSQRPAARARQRIAAALLDGPARLLFDHSLFNAHPRFFGYITAAPAPIGILGDFLASALNPNVGGWTLSPAATEIESQTVRWIAELIGYPADCGGMLVSGGNMANFVGFFAARAARAGWNVREDGVATRRARAARVRVGRDAHLDAEGGRLSGLGTAAIRWIPVDADLRMDVAALRAQIERDRRRRRRAAHGRGHGGLGEHRCGRSAAARSRRSAASTALGSTSTARMAASPRRFPAPPTICARSPRPTRWRSIRTSGSTLRSRPGVRSCAMPRRCARAFSYHPPYYHFEERADELRRLRAAELPRLPRAQGVARAAAGGRCRVSADDRRRHRALARRWRTPSARMRSWSSSRRR